MAVRHPTRRRVIEGAAALAAAAAAPARAASGYNFLTVGDWGRDSAGQAAVAKQMGLWAKANDAKFVMTVGDNFYNSGVQSKTDTRWKTTFEDVYSDPALKVPWHPALGNHDYYGKPQAQIDYKGPNQRWQMGGFYYQPTLPASTGPRVDIFVIDTTPIAEPNATVELDFKEGPRAAAALDSMVMSELQANLTSNLSTRDVDAQKTWLKGALAASTADWKIVFGHHAVFSGGDHGSSGPLQDWLIPLFKAHGVQAYVCGHDHDMQHIVKDDIHYICTGAGGHSRSVRKLADTRWAKGKEGGTDFFAFTGYRVEPEVLTVSFVAADGSVPWTASIPRPKPTRKAGAQRSRATSA